MAFNADGYESAVLGVRTLQAAQLVLANDLQLYAEGGIYGRVVDMPADATVARGVEIEGDDDGSIAAELDRLKALPMLADGIRWARLTGGAAIVVVTDDSGSLEAPLDPANLAQVQELRVFDLTDIDAPDRRYGDARQPNYGRPEVYRVRTDAAGGGPGIFRVHETRLIPIPGDPLPRRLRPQGIPWAGRSAVARPFAAIRRYTEGLRLALEVLKRKQQGVYRMQGLAEAIEAGLESVVQKRIDLVDVARGLLNTVAVDGEDDYSLQDMQLGGIKDLIGEFQVALSVETGIPVTILFGRSPAGQNATGEADFEGYYDLVEDYQRNRAGPALERLVSLILAQRAVTTRPENWSIKWPPLRSPTAKEEADIRKTSADAAKVEMDALNAAMDAGLSEDEARAYLTENRLYGLEPEKDDGRATAAQYAAQTG